MSTAAQGSDERQCNDQVDRVIEHRIQEMERREA